MLEFPVGTIIAWDNESIPENWAVCNGSNGTPNLVDRFIRGAAEDGDVETTGGTATHTHGNPDTGYDGGHNHGGSKSLSASAAGSVTGTVGTGATDAAQSHNHNTIVAENISSEPNHKHTVPDTDATSSNPSYVKRVFIMKTSL
jgi:hypothetical protein